MSAYDLHQLEDFFTGSKDQNQEVPTSYSNNSNNGENKPSLKEKIKKFLPEKEQFRHLPKSFTKKERYTFVALLFIAIASLIAIPISVRNHSTIQVPAHGGKIKEGIKGTPKYINPVISQNNDADNDLIELVYSGLMKYTEDGSLEPDLAEKLEISDDGLIYTFILRDNIFWHDGVQLTANDIAFTILTIQNQAYESPQFPNWQGVEVKVIDTKTITLKLKNRFAQFTNNTTLKIIPKHIWESVSPANFSASEYNTSAIGSGPYKISKINRGGEDQIKSISLSSNKKYHLGEPFIENITLEFFTSQDPIIKSFNKGNLDSISLIVPSYLKNTRQDSGVSVNLIKQPRYFSIFFNVGRDGLLEDKSIRQALSYGTDKDTLIKKVLMGNGTSISSPTLPEILNTSLPVNQYNFDKEKSKTILDNLGWKLEEGATFRTKKAKDNDSQEKLQIELITLNSLDLPAVGEEIKKQWAEIGVDLQLKTLSFSEIQKLIQDRNYDSILFGEALAPNMDLFSFWHSTQGGRQGVNLSSYSNRKVDNLLIEASSTLDDETRADLYKQAQELITNDSPAVFLYSPHFIYIQNKKIKGNKTELISLPQNRFSTVEKWYINTKREKKQSKDNLEIQEIDNNLEPPNNSTK